VTATRIKPSQSITGRSAAARRITPQRLSRTTSGAAGERRIRCPYIRDHTVADRLASYWQKRLNSLRLASGTIYATQRANGERISVTDYVNWTGTKDFILTGFRGRPIATW
jgi:hypothetical protein